MVALARQGKRSIVVLNKKDRFLDDDRDAILAKLRERLAGVVAAEDVVAVSASPRPIPVRIQAADGTVETVLRGRAARPRAAPRPDRRRPRARGGRPPRGQPAAPGPPAQQVGRRTRSRRSATSKAQAVIDKFQWITAAHGLHQPDPGARPDGHRRGPVPDDLRDRRGLRRRDHDGARQDDRRPDDPDAAQARAGRGGDLADRRPVQVDPGRLRGRGGGPGGLDGLPDPHLGPRLHGLLPPRPGLGRRRDAGAP